MAEMSKKRCVIVAAGSIDDTSAIKAYADSADFVIAADAGYVYCRDAGIEPDLFVGDYDSSKKPKTQNELIALNPIKDATDTETALTEAEKGDTRKLLFWVRSAAELTIPWLTWPWFHRLSSEAQI